MLPAERIRLETVNGLMDLEPLRDARVLRDLELVICRSWAGHLGPLRDHRTLQRLRLGTGSVRRNADFRSRLGYPDTELPPARSGDSHAASSTDTHASRRPLAIRDYAIASQKVAKSSWMSWC